ncbi:MAG TPA: NADH-quinone oxidoreductase subunit M [Chloroflexota bacterium]|nr:NADH-quinone oxidoreductase subunit M [Chloroflexota bacterium]
MSSTFPFLSVVILLPVAGAIVVPFMGRDRAAQIKLWALLVSLVTLGVAAVMLSAFRTGTAEMQFVEQAPWFPGLGISYHLGVDGISLLLVVLTALLTPVAIGASWGEMEGRPKEYAVFLLLLEAGMIGAFVALDLILFFLFWEAMLIPMYLIVGICGGERRIYAAFKFFLYTAVGSLLMLLAIIGLAILYKGQTGQLSFDLAQLQTVRVPAQLAMWMFLAFAFAFAIKVPVFPFHAWLPDAYTQAPTAMLVLATMMVKVGAYGFLRFGLTLFPAQMVAVAPVFTVLAVAGVVYASLVAIVQKDIVRLVAYSSVGHMAFIVLGIFSFTAQGISGATLQMLNHSISTGGLFVLVAMLSRRTKTTTLAQLGGLASRWPVLGALFTLVMFSSAGLPGLNGFVGEFLILLGTFQVQPVAAIFAGTGVVLAAIYLLWMFQRSLHGADCGAGKGFGDLTGGEIVTLVPVVVLVVWIGLFPTSLLSRMEASVGGLVSQVERVSQPSPRVQLTGIPQLFQLDR